MATTTNSEWDDIPSSSELFGGDFFGDELMEMYTADHGLNLGDNTASVITTSSASAAAGGDPAPTGADDETKHPGLLIAMNAAAMDGGLSPLGTSPEFVPLAAASDTTLPPYPMLTPQPAAPAAVAAPQPAAPAPAAPAPAAVAPAAPAPAAPIPATVTSAPKVAPPTVAAVPPKRPVAAVTVPAQAPTKKPKVAAAPAALPTATVPVARAQVPAKLAASGGIKAAVLPAPRPLGRVVSSTSVPQAAKATVAAARPPVAATMLKKPAISAVKTAVVPKDKMPVGGGINHQVIARPPAVPSSAAAVAAPHRILAPAPSQTAKAMAMKSTPSVPSTSSTGVKRAATEADFKDVASAAVSSLIQNASSSLKTGPKPMITAKPGDKTVDTSTAHINALTSQNWVTACNPVPTPDTSVSSAAACDKAARNARRATLTQEERAKQNRDRNREHARNTRLRKKAYVEELKRTLTELVAQRDAADLEKRHEAQRNREQREVRFRVMEEFLKLRGRNELNAARWVAILEDGFTFTLPKTTFRRMAGADKSVTDVNASGMSNSSYEQVLRGAAVVMEDSQHVSTFLQTVGGPASAATQVQIVYRCDRKRFFMDGNIAFMDFTANTLGAVAKGAAHEAVFRGSMKASFSPASNKLISVDMSFDTGALMHQIEAMGTPDAATAAAHEADALLDSLQMPQIFVDKKDVAVAHAAAAAAGPVSVSSDDGDRSTDSSTALLNA